MISEVMWLQEIAERSKGNLDGRKGCPWDTGTCQWSFCPWAAASFPVVAVGRCKKRMKMTGDGA